MTRNPVVGIYVGQNCVHMVNSDIIFKSASPVRNPHIADDVRLARDNTLYCRGKHGMKVEV